MKHALTVTVALLAAAGTAYAQGVPNPFSGMGRDSDKPISIAANTTTADIRNETATYAGNVRVEQGNLKLRSDSLSIRASKGTIMRIEAKGNVVLASPQGQATGATALYDITKRIVTLGGKVILAQGPNVMRGSSLVINLATGRAELTGAGQGGRVEGVFVPAKTPKIQSPLGGDTKPKTPEN
jgi:lipopolysaccharide export system protein LptA